MTAEHGFEVWVQARREAESAVPAGFADRVMEALPGEVPQPVAARVDSAQGWWRAAAILLAMTAAVVRITPMVQLFLSGHVHGVQP